MLDLQSIYFGQKFKEVDFKDLELIKKVKRLASKHQKQCTNACNGCGIVKGQMYYNGLSYGQQAGDYEKREYGYDVKSAYINAENEEDIFNIEQDKIQEKIYKLVDQFNNDKYALWSDKPLKVAFQGDPRGNTVKLTYCNDYIDLN